MPIAPPYRSPSRVNTGVARKREHDRERRAAHPWRKLYNTARWKRLRLAQLAMQPLCEICLSKGDANVATVCDHIEPHRGDVAKFWAGPFQSLCSSCHDGEKQRLERGLRR